VSLKVSSAVCHDIDMRSNKQQHEQNKDAFFRPSIQPWDVQKVKKIRSSKAEGANEGRTF
jgi:hypothetical protein